MQEQLLRLWKTAGQCDRLENVFPLCLQEFAGVLPISELLVVRWNGDLGFLETLGHQTEHDSAELPIKEKTDSKVISAFLSLFDETPLFIDANDVRMPEPISRLCRSHQRLLGFVNLKQQQNGCAFLMFVVSDQKKHRKSNLKRKTEMTPELLNNDASFVYWLKEIAAVLSTVIEREIAMRCLSQLRETAEAEKEAILTKLGRHDLASEMIVGMQQGLQRVIERVELIAATGTPVLIFGETGSGKALIARAIHNRSARASQPFLRVNCGAISPERIDSQLFGQLAQTLPHPPTVTDKTTQNIDHNNMVQHAGVLGRVDGGTLFLDDIHHLPFSAQMRLMQLLEHGILQSQDGLQTIAVDVRIIVATDRDLGAMVSESRFREELWYQLSVFPIRIPTLRERLDDLPDLAKHFAERAATRFGLPLVLPSKRDIDLLKMYSWPGNVRELGTVIDRAALIGNGKSLDVGTALGLPDRSMLVSHADSTFKTLHETQRHNNRWAAFQTIEPLDDILRRYFEYVLTITQGRIEGPSGAAAMLDVNPNTLRGKLKKLGVNWNIFKNESTT